MDHPISSDAFGRRLAVRPGDRVWVRIRENATTGFFWRAQSSEPSVLELIGSQFDLPETTAAGAAGWRNYEFIAHREGVCRLTFELARPWLRDDQPVEVGVVEVQIQQ